MVTFVWWSLWESLTCRLFHCKVGSHCQRAPVHQGWLFKCLAFPPFVYTPGPHKCTLTLSRWRNFDVVVVPVRNVFWQLLQQFAELVLAFFVWIGAIAGIQSWFHKLLRLVWELSLPLADWPVFSASIFSGKPYNFDLSMHISGNLLPHSLNPCLLFVLTVACFWPVECIIINQCAQVTARRYRDTSKTLMLICQKKDNLVLCYKQWLHNLWQETAQ